VRPPDARGQAPLHVAGTARAPRARPPHLLTCSSRNGWQTASNLSSISGGKRALTRRAAARPSAMASSADAPGKWMNLPPAQAKWCVLA